MRSIKGNNKVPVIYSAHHASSNFGEFVERVALNKEQKVRYSDYGTLETVPDNGISTIISEHSRGLGDLNRALDNPSLFSDTDFTQSVKNRIWLEGKSLTDAEKSNCIESIYNKYHGKIIELLKKQKHTTFVVAWDNTAPYYIGDDDKGVPVIMPSFVLSNHGAQDTGMPSGKEDLSCDTRFMLILRDEFIKQLDIYDLPSEVHLNLAYKGGYIAGNYSSNRNVKYLKQNGVKCQVNGLQLEYSTAITHDVETLKPNETNIKKLKASFSKAIEDAFEKY